MQNCLIEMLYFGQAFLALLEYTGIIPHLFRIPSFVSQYVRTGANFLWI